MSKVIQVQGDHTAALASAVTRFMPLAEGWSDFNQNLTEAATQVTYRTAGTFSGLWIYVQTNSRNGSTTLTVRKNGVNGNETLTIPSSTTGQFEDSVNTDSCVSGDKFGLQMVVAGSSGSIQPRMMRTLFDATTNTLKRYACVSSAGSAVTNTFYYSLSGRRDADNTNETYAQVYVPLTGTLKNMFVNVSANTRNGSSIFRTRNNGSNGSLSITVPSSTTGLFEDTSNSDSLVPGDLACFQYNNGGSSGSLTPNVIAVSIETLDSKFMTIYSRPGSGTSIAEALTAYQAVAGEHSQAQGADDRAYVKAGLGLTISKFSMYIAGNSFDPGSTPDAGYFRTRINSAFGNQILTITSGLIGRFTDAINSDAIISTSLVNFRVDTNTGDGLGILNWRNISMLWAYIVGPPSAIVFEGSAVRDLDQLSDRSVDFSSERTDVVESNPMERDDVN